MRHWLAAFAAGLATGCGPGPLDVVDLAPTTLSSGLVAHWTFDETEGTTLHDRSGNKRDGTVSGATWVTDGQFGGALHFHEGDTVAVDRFLDATSSWTVSIWIRVGTDEIGSATATIISTEVVFSGGWEINLEEQPSDRHLHFGYFTGLDPQYAHLEGYGWQPARWSHVTSVVDGQRSVIALYLDETLLHQEPVPKLISPGSSTLYFGKWTGAARLFAGSIDDVAIYDRALSAPEVVELQRHPAPLLQ